MERGNDVTDRRQFLLGAGAATAALAVPRARAAPPAPGWRPLFDGRSLDGWRFFQDGIGSVDTQGVVRIENGVLHFLGKGTAGSAISSGHLSTVEAFGNYHLRLEYKWGATRFAPRALQRRNSGLMYHMGAATDRLFPPCVEFQIEEGDVGDAIMVDTLGLQGPLLGGTPLWPSYFPGLPEKYEEPVRVGGLSRLWLRHAGVYERLDGWNTLDLYAFDDQAAHCVNGRIVTTLFHMVQPHADGTASPLTSGRIALEFEQAEVSFRNVGIRDLDAAAIARIKRQGSD